MTKLKFKSNTPIRKLNLFTSNEDKSWLDDILKDLTSMKSEDSKKEILMKVLFKDTKDNENEILLGIDLSKNLYLFHYIDKEGKEVIKTNSSKGILREHIVKYLEKSDFKVNWYNSKNIELWLWELSNLTESNLDIDMSLNEDEFDKWEVKFSEFSWNQMYQIRLGLEKGLDVSKYANPKFDSYQMEQIRLGLEKSLDVSRYADPRFTWAQMNEIRLGLEKSLEISKYADSKFDFDWKQMFEIRLGLEKGLDVSRYADSKFSWTQMHEIKEGLEEGVDVSKYADPKFSWEQMLEIRRELEKEKSNNKK